jgi:hypothetical protein
MTHITVSQDKVTTLQSVGGWHGAKLAARRQGLLFILLADGRGRLLYMDGGKLRAKTWASVSFAGAQS